MTAVAFLIPVLGRPQNVQPLVDSIRYTTPVEHRIVFIADPDDQAQHDAVLAARCDLITPGGNYAAKINLAAKLCDEPLLFLGADDLRFHPGWWQAATAAMTGDVRVVGTNDLGNHRVMRGDHATHCLVDRRYLDVGTIDEPGKLLHEGYPHEYVDDEFVQTARARGVFAAALDSHVEHLHPLWGKAPTDHLYDEHPQRMRAGRRLFRKRRPLWT